MRGEPGRPIVLNPSMRALVFGGDVGRGDSAKKNTFKSISVFAVPDLNTGAASVAAGVS